MSTISSVDKSLLKTEREMSDKEISKVFKLVEKLRKGLIQTYKVDKDNPLDGPARIAQECSVSEAEVRDILNAYDKQAAELANNEPIE